MVLEIKNFADFVKQLTILGGSVGTGYNKVANYTEVNVTNKIRCNV